MSNSFCAVSHLFLTAFLVGPFGQKVPNQTWSLVSEGFRIEHADFPFEDIMLKKPCFIMCISIYSIYARVINLYRVELDGFLSESCKGLTVQVASDSST